jgi:ribosomal protein S18 acetylase RimI-like enzyme
MLRRLELIDMDAAARVLRTAFDQALPWLTGLHTPEEDQWFFRERVFTTCDVWGAFDGAAMIGMLAFRKDWIDQLYVLPTDQRRGIGTELLQVAQSSLDCLHLWTFQRNIRARRFYEAKGFALVEETDGRRNEEKEPDALYLWKRLEAGMLSAAAANLLISRHLGDTPRAAHSRFVAYLMRRLAGIFAADADLWKVVGLCHDLDFFQTSGDLSQHGLLTIKWLGDRIPADAQAAITAHDHRTGIQADTLLADTLKAADAIAVIDERLGRRLLCDVDQTAPYTILRSQLGDRPYLCDILQRYIDKHGLAFARIVEIVTSAPSQ